MVRRKILYEAKKVGFWLVGLLALPWHPNNSLMTLKMLFSGGLPCAAQRSLEREEKKLAPGCFSAAICDPALLWVERL